LRSRGKIVAPFFLGLGITGDLYVATTAAVQSNTLGAVFAIAALGILGTLWYGLPVALRHRT
jgi:hypothetical protein